MRTGRNPIPFLGIAGLLAAFALVAGDARAEDIANYTVKDNNSIPQSLTGQPGDAKNGRNVAVHRQKGNCLACHAMPIPEQPFHGRIGPDLAGVGSRYDEGELRLRIANPKFANPDTIMPAFYKAEGFHRVLKGFEGKPMMSAQEVEDVIAYLMTLKE